MYKKCAFDILGLEIAVDPLDIFLKSHVFQHRFQFRADDRNACAVIFHGGRFTSGNGSATHNNALFIFDIQTECVI